MNPSPPAPPWQRPGALLLVWLCRTLAAILVALPVANAVSAPLASFPAGDRLLFAPGATYLVEVLRLSHAQVEASARTSGWLLVALGFAQLVPLGALLAALARPERLSIADLLAHGARHFPAFSLLSGLTLLSQAITLVALGFSTLLIRFVLRSPLGAPGADLGALTALLAILVVVGLIGAVQDLARAAIVASDTGLRSALVVAIRTFAAQPLPIAVEWLWRGLVGALLIVSAGAAAWALRPGQPGALRIAAIIALHQGAILATVYLRADWLRCALARVGAFSHRTDAAGRAATED